MVACSSPLLPLLLLLSSSSSLLLLLLFSLSLSLTKTKKNDGKKSKKSFPFLEERLVGDVLLEDELAVGHDLPEPLGGFVVQAERRLKAARLDVAVQVEFEKVERFDR
jgi:hypothetical protein